MIAWGIVFHTLLFFAPKEHPLVVEALSLVGLPYVTGSLENPKEDLVIRTDGFDCYTLVEHCVATVLSVQSQRPYAEVLERNRYRGGIRKGYGSRHHYFVGWAHEGMTQGWLQPVTHAKEKVWRKRIQFMSTHRGAYPTFVPLREWTAIQQVEQDLSRLDLRYIPKDSVEADLTAIQSGDILAFTSQMEGLDVNHEGIAYWKNNQLHLIHASLEEKKVVISQETLLTYLRRIKKHSGLMIFRLAS